MVTKEEKDKLLAEELEIFKEMRKDPFLFIRLMWGLIPQPRRYEEGKPVGDGTHLSDYERYIKGKHMSWQQTLLVQGVKDAINGKGSRKITARSGKGSGKTSSISWIELWFLYCYANSIITNTGPSSKQLQDGIWKEISVWLSRMPQEVQTKFEKTNEYLRVTERPAEWYARVITGTKENAENVAGVHADNVMAIADEASGISDEVMEALKGMMTSNNAILIMISNPTRLDGYFYNSHNKLCDSFQCFHFNCEESPNVDKKYVSELAMEHGIDSDDYRISVLGEFPKADGSDDGGRIPLLQQTDLHLTHNAEIEPFRLGIDPAGMGRDSSLFVARDSFKARIIGMEKLSDAKSVAGLGLTYCREYQIDESQVYTDNFGVGANVAQEMALAGYRINGINVGNPARDIKRFKNIRAEAYRALREWIKRGGELVNSKVWEDELLKIKYRRGLDGRIQIMPKADMKKLMGKSPDGADALMLTFIDPDDIYEEDEVISVSYGDRL